MLVKLKEHDKIGIDIDHTLISENPQKEFLRKFIIENQGKIDFFLITFRSPLSTDKDNYEWIDRVYKDIKKDWPEYKTEYFKGLYGVPKHLEKARKTWYNGFGITKELFEYLEWKGKMCHELGATALVDDMYDMVINGCSKYNVEYFNPIDLF